MTNRRTDRYAQQYKKAFQRQIVLGILCLAVFLVFTVLVCVYDRQPIGPENTVVGFAGLNAAFRSLTGVSFSAPLYKASKYLGYLSLLVAAGFVLMGFSQLVKNKSLKKVDSALYVMGVLFLVVFALYILFNHLPINYRPVVNEAEGVELELSYPSSHTMLALCVLLPAASLLRKRMSTRQMRSIGSWGCTLLAVAIVLLRLLSGVHWLTDILGAVLVSCSLLSFYYAAQIRFGR